MQVLSASVQCAGDSSAAVSSMEFVLNGGQDLWGCGLWVVTGVIHLHTVMSPSLSSASSSLTCLLALRLALRLALGVLSADPAGEACAEACLDRSLRDTVFLLSSARRRKSSCMVICAVCMCVFLEGGDLLMRLEFKSVESSPGGRTGR